MCGIVGYVGPKDCSEVLVNALTKLEYRGYDSAGIAVFDNGEIKTVKTKGKLQDLKDKLAEVGTPKGHVGIGHTRWATHGEPSDVNSHPHSGTRVTIVHNGIIENYMELKDFLISKGRTFLSDTDTEVVAQLLDYKYNGNPLETIDSVMAELKGSFALGIMFKDFPDRVFAVRRESPLIVGVAEGECFIASDVPAILQYTRDYYLLAHDEIVTLSPDGVSFVDEHLDPIEKELQTADWDMEAAEKGGYPHFMIKEINEQPEAIRTTIMPRIKEGLPFLEECGITYDENEAVLQQLLRKMIDVMLGPAAEAVPTQELHALELCPQGAQLLAAFFRRLLRRLCGLRFLCLIFDQTGFSFLAARQSCSASGAAVVSTSCAAECQRTDDLCSFYYTPCEKDFTLR